jgi:VIT1/CCC1 family predicted Fe2+/Mn2+ transporter
MTTKSSSYWVQIARNEGINNVDRLNEVLFGLIMVLTFTCSISAATAGREEVSTVLWSALGCNVAWGFVDAFMYLFAVLLERGESYQNLKRIQNANTEASGKEAIREALPPFLSRILNEDHIQYLNDEIRRLPQPPERVSLTFHDMFQALKIFLLVFFSTFPVTLPFLFFQELTIAMRVSNGIALTLMFLTGLYLAKQTGRRKVPTALAFALLGVVLVAVTMALGG